MAAAASSSMNDSKANVTCGPLGSRRLPVRSGVSQIIGSADDTRRRAPVRNGVHRRTALRRCPWPGVSGRRPMSCAISTVSGSLYPRWLWSAAQRVVLERHHLALSIQPAAQLEDVGRALGIPRRFFVTHPLHAHRAAELLRQERRFETGIVRGGAAVHLRAIHVDHAHLLARHVEELARRRCAGRRTSCRWSRSSSARRKGRPARVPGRWPCVPGRALRTRLRSHASALASAAAGSP